MDPFGMPRHGPRMTAGTVLIIGTSRLWRTTRALVSVVVRHLPRAVVGRCQRRLPGRVWARNNGPLCGGPRPTTWCTTIAKTTRGTILSHLNVEILDGGIFTKMPLLDLKVHCIPSFPCEIECEFSISCPTKLCLLVLGRGVLFFFFV